VLKDLHILPKVRDSISQLYVEHARIDRHENAIALHDASGSVPVPVASLAVLMLGPGTDITQAAIRVLAENNCLVIWCGEENVRFYASGTGGTRSSTAMLRQAWLASDERRRLGVVRRMYQMRFAEELDPQLTLEQVRGLEGMRVRAAYERLARECGIEWKGRSYDRGNWRATDIPNRALSVANSCLYGVCHAAILSVGLSPAIGFIHTGKQLSFVYDVADLYKVEVTVPIAFRAVSEGVKNLEREVRVRCREAFRERRLLTRIVPDLFAVMGEDSRAAEETAPVDEDAAVPADWWGDERMRLGEADAVEEGR